MSPILAPNRHRYPADWPEIRARILRRARNRCEECGVLNHVWGWRDGEGTFHRVFRHTLREAGYGKPPFDIASTVDGSRWVILHIFEIVLTISHTDHDPAHCDDDNLLALCQQCHNRHDRKHRDHTRRYGCEVGQLQLLGGGSE